MLTHGRADETKVAVVAGLQDMATAGEAGEQRGGYFCVAEYRSPFAEAQICGGALPPSCLMT